MRKNILFLFLITLSLEGFCQTPIVFESTKTHSYILSYSAGGDQSQRIVNDILRIISGAMNKPLHQTRIRLEVDEHLWITRNGRTVNAHVSYEQFRLTGDNFYKGFEVAEEMIPSHYSFECALKRKNGLELKRFNVSELSFHRNNGDNRFEYNDTMQNGDYVLEAISRDFQYKYQAFDRFKEKCQLIDMYYSAEGEIASCYGIVEVLNTENFRQINNAQQQLDQLISRINSVEGAPFWHKLNIRSYDPIHIYPKLQDTKLKISDKQTNINYVRNNLHRFYYESALQSFNSNRRNEARNDFRQSVAINAQYAQPIYYLALMDFEDGDATASMSRLSDFFSLSSIENELYEKAKVLAKDVEKANTTEVRKLISHQHYTSALSKLDEIATFCTKIRSYSCNDSINILRSDVHNAVYQSFINDAQCDFTVGKYDEASNTISKAMAYQATQNAYVFSNETALALMKKVKEAHYLALVKRGRNLITTKDYRNAFDALNKASDIELSYTVKNDKQLPELLKKSKLELLYVDADNAQNFVTANNLVKAKEILMTVISDQSKYQLKDIVKLNQKIETLKQAIFSKQCMNAQAEYDKVIETARKLVREKEFIIALSTFQKAKLYADQNSDCQLNTDSATQGVLYTQNPAKYQQDIIKAKHLATKNDFAGATALFVNTENFFNQNKLIDYQIEHQTLTQFISQYNTNYIQWGATYMVNNQDFASSLTLLYLLKDKKISRSKTKSIQIGLANGLAVIDYKSNSDVNAKLKVVEYTKGDKWFKYFTKQYQKQLKSFNKK